MRSIERVLTAWVLGALSLGALTIVGVTYFVTLDEMNEVFDADLKNVAEALGSYHRSGLAPDPLAPRRVLRTDAPSRDEIVTLTWTGHGEPVFSSDPRVAIPFSAQEALRHLRIGSAEWIVYTDVSVNGVAQAAQRASSRHDAAGEAASKVFLPLIALVIGVEGLMLVALRRGLRPLAVAARDVAARTATSLDPIPTLAVPAEMLPLVAGVNGLMARLSQALGAQRRFVADAAHELRTPVTALRLQLQLLQQAEGGAARADAMAELDAGIERARRLTEQLLQVARSGAEGGLLQLDRADLADLVRQVVAQMSSKAAHRDLDLGAVGETAVPACVDREAITVLLNNLVENALRYTPAGGTVDVGAWTEQGRPVLRVADNGPGIPAAEHAAVSRRFHRGSQATEAARDAGGSGLGLAIVKAIAMQHGASVSLHTAAGHRGLAVRVVFEPVIGSAADPSVAATPYPAVALPPDPAVSQSPAPGGAG